mmetsp:Transcript_990/g.1496  ORF Transcript_990/g.1496 Transcript_990/m.1496 type:complete len:247 (-) Transcript_990:108-848(-)
MNGQLYHQCRETRHFSSYKTMPKQLNKKFNSVGIFSKILSEVEGKSLDIQNTTDISIDRLPKHYGSILINSKLIKKPSSENEAPLISSTSCVQYAPIVRITVRTVSRKSSYTPSSNFPRIGTTSHYDYPTIEKSPVKHEKINRSGSKLNRFHELGKKYSNSPLSTLSLGVICGTVKIFISDVDDLKCGGEKIITPLLNALTLWFKNNPKLSTVLLNICVTVIVYMSLSRGSNFLKKSEELACVGYM